MSSAEFEVFLNSADFKFYCAHFIIHDGFREKLHGHNYQVSIRLTGRDQLGSDGYLIDFGEVKKILRSICRELNEYFICPMKSPNMKVITDNNQLCLECDDGANFSFPLSDCALLPIHHSSAEEITHYLWCTIVKRFGVQHLHDLNVKKLEVNVAEWLTQTATFRSNIPIDEADFERIESLGCRCKPSPCFPSTTVE